MSERNPTRTRMKIIEAATAEFSEKGYGGARVDQIVKRASISKNLLYHYFKSKEDLFVRVLEHNYSLLRAYQNELQLEAMTPEEGIQRLVTGTFRYFLEHPEIMSLLNTENLHQAEHIRQSTRILEMYHPLVESIKDLLARGVEEGVFRKGVDPIELYITISGLGYYYLACQYTLSTIFKTNLADPKRVEQRHRHIVEVVLAYLRN